MDAKPVCMRDIAMTCGGGSLLCHCVYHKGCHYEHPSTSTLSQMPFLEYNSLSIQIVQFY